MATKSKPSKQGLKQLRSDLAKLKRAGLYTGDARAAKGGWRQKALVKQYADVLSGKAKVVKVGKDAKKFDKTYRPKAGRVVVQAAKNERPRYSKKSGGIVSTLDEYGTKFRRIQLLKGLNAFQNLPSKASKGKMLLFKLSHGPLQTREAMQQQLNKYKNKKGIFDAVEIYEVSKKDFPQDEDDLDEYLYGLDE